MSVKSEFSHIIIFLQFFYLASNVVVLQNSKKFKIVIGTSYYNLVKGLQLNSTIIQFQHES